MAKALGKRATKQTRRAASIEPLEHRVLLTFALTRVRCLPSAIAADPIRNVAYIADSTKPEVIVLNTKTATMAAHPLGAGAQALAVAVDGSELYVAEGQDVQVFSLPSWQLARTLHLDVSPNHLYAGVNHRIYAETGELEQIDALTGADLARMDIQGNIVGVSPDGTRLAEFWHGVSSAPIYHPYYDLTYDGCFVGVGLYLAPCSNGQDVAVDNELGRVYTASAGVSGVNVSYMDTGKKVLWPGLKHYEYAPDGYAVTFNAQANRVFGANYLSIREYNRTDGSTVADYSIGWDINRGDMAATRNGRAAFISAGYNASAIGLTDVSSIQLAGSAPGFCHSVVDGYYTFDASPTTFRPGSPATAYQWDFGDGSTASGLQPTHRFASVGQYKVTLTIDTSSGASSVSQVVNVTELGGLAATVSLDAPANVTSGSSFAASAHVTAASGQPSGGVLFIANGVVVGSAPLDANGGASAVVPYWNGSKTLVARYSGDATYAAVASDGVVVAIPNFAPTVTVSLGVASGQVQTDDVLTATAVASDDNHDPLTLTFVWKANGLVQRTFSTSSTSSDSFDLGVTGHGDRGETVTVEVTPNDGIVDGAMATGSVVVVDTAPGLGDVSKRTIPGDAFTFSLSDVTASFTDADSGDALRAVRIEALPSHGVLTLAGAAVTAGQEISDGQIASLTYTPTASYTGTDSFTWSASDDTLWSQAPGAVHITVRKLTPPSVLIYSPTADVHVGEMVQVSVLVTMPDTTSPIPSATVSIKNDDGTVLATVELVDGQASCAISGMTRGYHQLSATYAGDGNYRALTSAAKLSVHVGAANVVDVLALYTPAAAAVYSNFPDAIYEAFAVTNDALMNSQINLSLKIADVAETNYTESGSYSTDLARLRAPNDGYMDEAASLRDTYGADLVCLFVGSAQPDDPYGLTHTVGLSYMMRNADDPTNASWGFSEVYIGSTAYTLAHELGHNFGAQHDVAHASGPGVFSDSYGYRFQGNDGVWYHDIMSYNGADSDVTVPYYSNPDLTYAGQPIGVAGSSNVARTINYTAPIVAAYEPTKVPLVTPTITTVTAPPTVVSGQSITPSATIAGQLANPHLPDGTVTFLDGDYVLGTATASAGAASWTGTLPAGSNHQIRALYQSSGFFGDSMSSPATTMTIPTPTLSGGSLAINGTAGDDTLKIAVSGLRYVVTLDGQVSRFRMSAVTGVSIDVGDGNDCVDVSALMIPATIHGGGGNDTITGGAGADSINGGLDNDVIYGGLGADTLLGGSGADLIFGNGGADSISGGKGLDTLYGAGGADTILGGASADLIYGQAGMDSLDGGAGDDMIYGSAGNDTIVGGTGNDVVYAGGGDDWVYVDDGAVISYHDTVYTGTGVNQVDHDAADILVGEYVDILG